MIRPTGGSSGQGRALTNAGPYPLPAPNAVRLSDSVPVGIESVKLAPGVKLNCPRLVQRRTHCPPDVGPLVRRSSGVRWRRTDSSLSMNTLTAGQVEFRPTKLLASR